MPQDVDPRFGRPHGRGPHPGGLDPEVAKVVRSSPEPLNVRGIQRALIEAGIVRSTTAIRGSIDRLMSDGALERMDVRDGGHHQHAWRCPSPPEDATPADGTEGRAPGPGSQHSAAERILRSLRAGDIEVIMRADPERFVHADALAAGVEGPAVTLLVRRRPDLFGTHPDRADCHRLTALGHAVQLLARTRRT